jgi:transposase
MNVLNAAKKATLTTLLKNEISQREISRKARIDRKTIRKYGRQINVTSSSEGIASGFLAEAIVATGSNDGEVQNPPPRPPGNFGKEAKIPFHARSACEPHRPWIEQQVRLGRNATAIYQDLVEQFSFTHRYNSVKRFVRGLRRKDPEQYDRLDFLPGEEAQVDYGQGAKTLGGKGKYLRPRLFVMTLKYSGRSFRKVIWKSGQESWARLHEEAFRYFGGCPEYVVLDNLKEGVITPDIYEPELNPLYMAVLTHYGVTADPARVRDPDRKGTVENAIQHTQNTALKGRAFEAIDEQNSWLIHWEEKWAATRIHGRMKRQVEEMFQEERPFLRPLPLIGFQYFRQETRKVSDDGTIQVGQSYYSALPAPLHQEVIVRIYADEIEIIDPRSMEKIRTHQKSHRAGEVKMEPEDRIFNPSRQTDYLLSKAKSIGPNTRRLCDLLFEEQGRIGQRRMQGIVNLARRYEACHIEQTAHEAIEMGLRSYKAFCRLVDIKKMKESQKSIEAAGVVRQEHELIRPATDYGEFFDQYAAKADKRQDFILSREQLPDVWQNASWPKVIDVFGLEPERQSKSDEIWLKSPFSNEEKASLHVNLTHNIFKDFSSGKGGGILNFCQELLEKQDRHMNCYQVAGWMVENGISTLNADVAKQKPTVAVKTKPTNKPISVDLRPFLRPEPVKQRGVSKESCQYLGCGYLPERPPGEAQSPLNGRVVFQVRGLVEEGAILKSVILGHIGRALTDQQEATDGKYWGFPFHKRLEIYNQDKLLMDPAATEQVKEFGLVLVEGFFDVAALVEAGCLNVGALMGAHITAEQIDRLKFINAHAPVPRITLFLDRDEAGRQGTKRAAALLEKNGFVVTSFDWDQVFTRQELPPCRIGPHIKDPGDLSFTQIKWLRKQGII